MKNENELYINNYCTLKKRGFGSDCTYIFSVHKCRVRRSGFQTLEYLKDVNTCKSSAISDDFARFASSVSRSMSKVLQLAFNNKWDYFVTLTVSPESCADRYDLNSIVKFLLKFFDNYKQRFSSDFKYLLVPEMHKDGAFHFHGFLAGIRKEDLKFNKYGYLDFVPYCNKFGFCSMSAIRDHSACSSYAAKYVNKDMFGGNVPAPYTHLYFASKGLRFDEILRIGVSCFNPDATLNESVCIIKDNEFCTQYYSKSDFYSDYIADFVNVTASRVRSVDYSMLDVEKLQKLVTLKFCRDNGIFVSKNADLLSLYKTFKDDIASDSSGAYDSLREYFRQLRSFKVETLTAEEASEIEKIFDVLEMDLVLNDPEIGHNCAQMSLFN